MHFLANVHVLVYFLENSNYALTARAGRTVLISIKFCHIHIRSARVVLLDHEAAILISCRFDVRQQHIVIL